MTRSKIDFRICESTRWPWAVTMAEWGRVLGIGGAGGRARAGKTGQNYSAMPTEDPHKPIRDDVRLLGELLGEMLRRQEGAELFDRRDVRALAKARRVAIPPAPTG
jgi:hypothetical protein